MKQKILMTSFIILSCLIVGMIVFAYLKTNELPSDTQQTDTFTEPTTLPPYDTVPPAVPVTTSKNSKTPVPEDMNSSLEDRVTPE